MFGLVYDLDLFNIVAVPDFNMYEQIVDFIGIKELMLLCLLLFLLARIINLIDFWSIFRGAMENKSLNVILLCFIIITYLC